MEQPIPRRKKGAKEKSKDFILGAFLIVMAFTVIVSADVDKCSDCIGTLVPYTGAVGNVDLGNYNLTAASVISDNTSMYIGDVHLYSEGTLLYVDNDLSASNIYGDGYHITNLSQDQIEVYYGEMWNYTPYEDGGLTFPIAVVGVYYNYTDLHNGTLNGFTFSNGVLTALNAGTYGINGEIGFTGGLNGEYGFGVMKNYDRTISRNCYNRKTGAGNIGDIGITCIQPLAAGDTLNIQIEDENGPAQGIDVFDVSVTAVRLGP